MNLDETITYQEVLAQTNGSTRHLLLGNGFSIACDPIFSYGSLYDRAVARGLSDRAVQLFARLGTNNFEAVLRLLADGQWLGEVYGIPATTAQLIQNDFQIVKETLIAVIAESHPGHTGRVADNKKASAAEFFNSYQNVFSLNYDLLPYWINMAASNPPPFEDGFRADPDDPENLALLFCEPPGSRRAILFPHGALHIFSSTSGIRKHSWIRTGEPLTDLVRDGLERNQFPLFVAEGTSEEKRRQILNNSYLAYCFGKLGRIEKPLVTFGWSFGDSDRHIVDTIANALKVRKIFVGIIGNPRDQTNAGLVRNLEYLLDRRSHIAGFKQDRHSLEIRFYTALSAAPWGTNT